MDNVRVCLLKIMPAKGDLAGNMHKLENVLQQTPFSGVDVLITSECYLDGYVSTEDHVNRDNVAEYSVQDDSPYLVRAAGLSLAARTTRLWVARTPPLCSIAGAGSRGVTTRCTSREPIPNTPPAMLCPYLTATLARSGS